LEAVWRAIRSGEMEPEIERPPGRQLSPNGSGFSKCEHVDAWLLAPDQTGAASSAVRAKPPWRLLGLARAIIPDTDNEILGGTKEICERLESAGGDVYFADSSVLSNTLLHIGKFTWEYHRKVMAHDALEYHFDAVHAQPGAFAPGLLKFFAEGTEVSEEEYDYCLCFRESTRQDIDRTLHWVDAILTPAATSLAPPLSANSTGDPRWNSPFSLSGHPTICCPVGRGPGNLPWGIQLVGPYHSEARLLEIARWIELVLSQNAAKG